MTEDQIQTLARARASKSISTKLAQLPPSHGLGIAMGVFIDVSKHYGLTVEQALQRAWDITVDE